VIIVLFHKDSYFM